MKERVGDKSGGVHGDAKRCGRADARTLVDPVLTTVLAAAGPTRVSAGRVVPNLTAYHAGFLAAAGIALLASLAAITVSDGDAAATLVRRGRLAARTQKAAVAVEVA